MNFEDVLKDSSAGILVTDENFRVVWANKFEEDYYKKSLEELTGIWVVDCHKEDNKEKIKDFLQNFKSGELTQYTKKALNMIITYSSYYQNNKFAGIVRTRIRMPNNKSK